VAVSTVRSDDHELELGHFDEFRAGRVSVLETVIGRCSGRDTMEDPMTTKPDDPTTALPGRPVSQWIRLGATPVDTLGRHGQEY
jgi:hypothetical protein